MEEAEKVKTIDIARAAVIRIEIEHGKYNPELRSILRANYPFSQKFGYPYQAWLTAIRERIGGMRLKKPDPNQLPLI